eukprot:GFYU01020552.1.p1 GENE.GFYU01020552.1~~GFYU01020552.1.p1  ORF type:complete len:102 (+),score=31.90 GFYU01020552.1:117-422(+)
MDPRVSGPNNEMTLMYQYVYNGGNGGVGGGKWFFYKNAVPLVCCITGITAEELQACMDNPIKSLDDLTPVSMFQQENDSDTDDVVAPTITPVMSVRTIPVV